MHRNTFLLVALLAVIAALIIGVNIGKKLSPSQSTSSSPVTATPSPTSAPTPPLITYNNSSCGLSFQYPKSLTKTENASGSAVFTDTSGQQAVAVTCQTDIPQPALDPTKIETLRIINDAATSSVSAKLYHDTSAKDGSPIDIIIWRSPKTTLDVYVAGYGETFNQILQTLRLLP
jgi:hypothetical protein